MRFYDFRLQEFGILSLLRLSGLMFQAAMCFFTNALDCLSGATVFYLFHGYRLSKSVHLNALSMYVTSSKLPADCEN